MKWVKVAAEGVSRVSYYENSQALKIKFNDGSTGLAAGVTPARYAGLTNAAPPEQTTYFRNLIAPLIVKRRGGDRVLRRAAKIIATLIMIWVLFQFIDWIRLPGN